ncbi:hypothetical protein [Micromonospora sp. KC723]|uniref:hypothetical protein n=1 Tax=Micromonospora sp. KC723 TaxID=2530381 RepID=UPI00104F1D88|nr:hypothetical protein [Micromonospora sp. KC723]TDB78110.1 hypothetical protein E1165_01875 [Micromonospora sp. KC723]
MSKRFLTKLAGGAVLGSAALLLAAPAAALATTDGPTKEPRNSNQEREWERDSADETRENGTRKRFNLRDSEGNGVTCATNDQNADANVIQNISDNVIVGGANVFTQTGVAAATNVNAQAVVVCIRDIELDVDVDIDVLDNILDAVESATTGGTAGWVPGLGGVYAGPDGAWVNPGRVS